MPSTAKLPGPAPATTMPAEAGLPSPQSIDAAKPEAVACGVPSTKVATTTPGRGVPSTEAIGDEAVSTGGVAATSETTARLPPIADDGASSMASFRA